MSSDANYGSDSSVSEKKAQAHWQLSSSRREYLENRQLEILKILQKNDLAVPGWEKVVQPWNEHVCKKWISWGHILRYWEIARQEKLAKEYRAPIKWCTHNRYRMELIEAYKKFYKNDMDDETLIPYWLAAMVFAKVFLNCAVDWMLSDKKHSANIRQAFTKGTPQPTDVKLENSDDAAKATPQVPPIHVTSSKKEDDDDVTLGQLLAQIRVKGKRPFNPSKDDEDESLSTGNFRRIRRGPRVSTGDNEDATDQGVPHEHTVISHDVQGETQNEDTILQDLIPRLNRDIQREQLEKQMLHEKMEELKKTNEEDMVLQAETSRLKEEIRVLEAQLSRLQEKNTGLQAQLSRLQEKKMVLQAETSRLTEKSRILEAQISRLQEENMVLQAETSRLKEKDRILQAETSRLQEENMVLQAETSRLKEKDKVLRAETSRLQEENMVLQAQTSRLKEKDKVLQAETSRLQEEDMVLQAQTSRLKEKDRILQAQTSRLQERNMDLQAQISRLNKDSQKEVTANGEGQVEIQRLKEEIEKIKNEKQMIVQLDESQFGKITDLISQTLLGSNVAS